MQTLKQVSTTKRAPTQQVPAASTLLPVNLQDWLIQDRGAMPVVVVKHVEQPARTRPGDPPLVPPIPHVLAILHDLEHALASLKGEQARQGLVYTFMEDRTGDIVPYPPRQVKAVCLQVLQDVQLIDDGQAKVIAPASEDNRH